VGLSNFEKYLNKENRKENIAHFDRIVVCDVVRCNVIYRSKIFLMDCTASDKILQDMRGKRFGHDSVTVMNLGPPTRCILFEKLIYDHAR
jgi:hypothetical protein